MTGVTLELTGDANDYVGKGLCGGRIIIKSAGGVGDRPGGIDHRRQHGAVRRDRRIRLFRGLSPASGSRCATPARWRWSEGCGDHGCEYMTGGAVAVLGYTGRNFAAGMSGGVAYVLDEAGDVPLKRCNLAMVELEPVPEEDDLIERLHHHGGDLETKGRVDVTANMTRHDEDRLKHDGREPRQVDRLGPRPPDPRALGDCTGRSS